MEVLLIMIESIFILLIVMSILFFILTILWKSLTLGTMDIILWFILSISIYHYEIPYVVITSNDTIITGTQIIEEGLYPLSYLFIGMALITLLYLLTYIIFPMLKGRYSRMM